MVNYGQVPESSPNIFDYLGTWRRKKTTVLTLGFGELCNGTNCHCASHAVSGKALKDAAHAVEVKILGTVVLIQV